MRTPANHVPNYLFRCDKCQFITDNKKDYRRHTASAKHAKRTGVNIHRNVLPSSEPITQQHSGEMLPHLPDTCPVEPQPGQLAFIFDKHIYKYCEKCGSKYHSKSGLWKHRKMCEFVTPESTTASAAAAAPVALLADQEFKTIIMDMLKNNQDFQHKLIEMMCSHQSLAINAAATAAATATATAAGGAGQPSFTHSSH